MEPRLEDDGKTVFVELPEFEGRRWSVFKARTSCPDCGIEGVRDEEGFYTCRDHAGEWQPGLVYLLSRVLPKPGTQVPCPQEPSVTSRCQD